MQMLRFCPRYCAVKNVQFFSTEAVRQQASIEIPHAIQRGKTDILRALADTVGTDTTAPHFAFIDDPAMIPSTAQNKRTYYMAKEMGKRAARELASEWPTLFAFDRDAPYLPAFRPQQNVDPMKVEATEENLLSMIHRREVKDAILLYERIRSENVEVSDNVQMRLFELCCYYNSTDVPFSELEEWHGLRNFGLEEKHRWKEGDIADLLFETVPRTAESVSTMICGLCKFPSGSSVKRAAALFLESNGSVNREACNSLISVSQWEDAQKVLKSMSSAKISPDVQTFNALIASATKIDKLKDRIAAISTVMGEMSACTIQPSLMTFDLVLKAFKINELDEQKDKEKHQARMKVAMSWLYEMVSELDSRKVIGCTNVNDPTFFISALDITQRGANLPLAERIISLYEGKNNEAKLPVITKEGMLYHRYLMLFIERTSSMEEIFLKYRSTVPRSVGVTKLLVQVLVDRLQKEMHWGMVLRLVQDSISARLVYDIRAGVSIRNLLMHVKFENLSVSEREQFTRIVRRLSDIWVELSRFTEPYNKRLQLKQSISQISECALLLNRIGDSDRAFDLLNLILDENAQQGEDATVLDVGYPRREAMDELFEDSLRMGDAVRASTCLEIMSHHMKKDRLEHLVRRIEDRCDLTEPQRRVINGFVRLRPQ